MSTVDFRSLIDYDPWVDLIFPLPPEMPAFFQRQAPNVVFGPPAQSKVRIVRDTGEYAFRNSLFLNRVHTPWRVVASKNCTKTL